MPRTLLERRGIYNKDAKTRATLGIHTYNYIIYMHSVYIGIYLYVFNRYFVVGGIYIYRLRKVVLDENGHYIMVYTIKRHFCFNNSTIIYIYEYDVHV